METNTVASANNDGLKQILMETLRSAQSVGGEVYTATKGIAKNAIDFAQAQIPDVIHQLIVWEFWYHFIWAVFFIIVSIAFPIALYKAIKYVFTAHDEETGIMLGVIGSIFLLVILGVGTVPGAIENSLTCVKIKTAPKVFLIEYCNDLVKDGGKKHAH
jgi:hypothetical protein